MSEEDPFDPKPTRPMTHHTDRRESLRSDLECKFVVNNDPFAATANVSLTGAFFFEGEATADIGDTVEVELGTDKEESLTLPATVGPAPGDRDQGFFLRFQELEFEQERRLARLLDETADFDENSFKPD
jgi:hypothetical protein